MEDKRVANTSKTQNVYIQNRTRMTVTGIEDVDSFNEESVILFTSYGILTIVGQDLHINKLNIEEGELIIQGKIIGVNYSDAEDLKARSTGFLGKMFK
ncbi:MAG: sporulation protein YabP [Clostridia bacterium]|nr:sporulation protein YabP [Clostridia bacterium]